MIEMKSHGENLHKAMNQALDYYKELKQDDLPQYILACDFQKWYLLDKHDNSDHIFILEELADNIGLFGFMTDRPKAVKADSVNRDTVQMIAKIFDELKKADFGSGPSSYFLTRIVFCLFADDTGIFPDRNMFQDYIKETAEDGSDTGSQLRYLFENVLNTHRDDRSKNMGQKVRSFPYIDGDLFSGSQKIPDFNQNMRELLIKSGQYDWSKVSPAIFGTMFQTVMDQDARYETGSHYTTEENILKVIRPLFLDRLNEEFDKIDRSDKGSQKCQFVKFQDKLASLKFLDPACGSGNFLVIAYRELRRLEHRTIVKIYGFDSKKMDTEKLSKMDVNQFFGIEIGEFSAKIAEVSLWMMDHMMNVELNSMIDGLMFRRIPIVEKPHIRCGDALEFDWNEFLPSKECYYVFGNPPFSGSKTMTNEQRQQIRKEAGLGGTGGTLDYVCSWFIKASKYVSNDALVGFVSTSSITQGEQVGQLWPILFDAGVSINFAYKSFKWDSEATGKARVAVVIIGFGQERDCKKQLFYYKDAELVEDNPKHISPYLIGTESKYPIVKETSKPLNGLPKIKVGSQLIDGGYYTFTKQQKEEFLEKEPNAEPFMREFTSADDFINGSTRWVLFLREITPKTLHTLPETMKRVKSVQNYRLKSRRDATKELAEVPKLYAHNIIPTREFLLIPRVSSEKRKYIPIGYIQPGIIPSDATSIIENTSLGLFGLLVSEIHMVWLRMIGGKLETRYRYSAGMVYNTFPIPKNKLDVLEPHAQKILDIRNEYSDSTLADLYDPITMPDDLKKAHKILDKKVERLYQKKPFSSDQERLECLLKKYKEMIKDNQTTLNN